MTSKPHPTYPLVPRSTTALLPGQFWAIPLSDGSFGCGRVIELKESGALGARVSFLAAVMDWHGDTPPTPDGIAGAKCLAQGEAHLKAITETGGAILGHRSLIADAVVPFLFRTQVFLPNSFVQRGYQVLRPAESPDGDLPAFPTWGFKVITVVAEKHFLHRA